MPISDQMIRETYLRYFGELHSSIRSAMKTATYLWPEEGGERLAGWLRIRALVEDIEIKAGVPFRLAVRDALQRLTVEGADEAMRKAWLEGIAAVSRTVQSKDWNPRTVEFKLERSSKDPWIVLSFDEAGVLQQWSVMPNQSLQDALRTSRFAGAVQGYHITGETTVDSLKEGIEQQLGFMRTRYMRGRVREGGGSSIAEYPHELVASFLPVHVEYATRWSLPDERSRMLTEQIFEMSGVKPLRKEMEETHAVIQVPDLVFLKQLLNTLADKGLISKSMLGDDVVQVATDYWDGAKQRWVTVSEVVAAFDELEGRRKH